MPELPDIIVYVERLNALYGGETLVSARLNSPFVLRTVEPPWTTLNGRVVIGFERLGKRIVWLFEGGLCLSLHLMIAGRLHERPSANRDAGRKALAIFDFTRRTLVLTEASTKQRAALHLFANRQALTTLDRGGLEVLDAALPSFAETLRRENHTLKRALTDPSLFSGIGNAYSDEILHAARLSPLALTQRLTDQEVQRLHHATQATLAQWIEVHRQEVGSGFSEKVTAFHEHMAVHGRYRKPCPICAAPIQRIRYAEHECNYCPQCQTTGRILADRSLSRLLKQDWPRTLEELEQQHQRGRG